MHEELNQFVRNDVWELALRPKIVHVIDTKWIFKNKTDEEGEVIRNKSWLVAQGYIQVEGVDFDESFAPVARLESIRILMSIACTMNFKLYQIDVKCAFLNGYLNEEVFVEQPKGFEDPHFPDHVLRLKKKLLEFGMIGLPITSWIEDSKGDMSTGLYLSRMMKIIFSWLKYMLIT